MAEYLVQDTSLTAVADAIREKGGTSEPLGFPEGMAAAVRSIQSGGDLSLGITGATPGQIVRVKAVDEASKPTEWETVRDLTREPYELIKEITLTEPVASINILSNDEGVSLSGAMVLWAIPGIADLGSAKDIRVTLRSDGGKRYYSYDNMNFRANESEYAFKIVEIKLFDTYSISTIMSGRASKPILTCQGIDGANSNAICRYTSAPSLETTLIRDLNTFIPSNFEMSFPAGTIIKLYGVKA